MFSPCNFTKLSLATIIPTLSLGILPLSLHAQKHPNIILINADDLGYGDLSCYGAKLISTPNIDKLAKDGMRFTDAHSPSAVCSPSRYGLLTGRYPLRRNIWGPLPYTCKLTIEEGTPTLGKVLKKAGYSTACIGKWHLGFGKNKTDWNKAITPGPIDCGFDYYFGVPSVNSGPPFVYVENTSVVGYDPKDPFVRGKKSLAQQMPEKSRSPIGGADEAHKAYVDELIGTTLCKKSVEWINKQPKGSPYFLYLATTNIHHPFTPAKQFIGTSKCGAYGDFVHELDWMVGEVVKAAEARGDIDNTLIIFTSDNGGMLNVTGQKAWKAGHRLNGKLLGFKFGAWEGGHRIPFIAKWKKKIPEGTESHNLISQIDLINTFASITEQPLVETSDSLNILPEFLGKAVKPTRSELIIHCNSPKHLAIRTEQWLYIPTQDEGGFDATKWGEHLLGGAAATMYTKQPNSDVTAEGKIKADAPKAQLYNLTNDPYQTSNVYSKFPETAKELQEKIDAARKLVPPSKPLGWISKQ